MRKINDSETYLYGLWDLGQQHLAAGRYVPARRALEGAEAAAWRRRDARSLARIYLPLLEARRQIRYNAAEGVLIVGDSRKPVGEEQRILREFLKSPAGTVLFVCSAGSARYRAACFFAERVEYASRRSGRWLEALLLVRRGGEIRVVSPGDSTFAAGLPVRFTTDPKDMIGGSTDAHLTVPVPLAGRYTGGPLHALLRESLLIGWEALALKWQHRHAPLHAMDPWEELAWLRRALRVDPACEPITMRLIALAEAVERTSVRA